MEVLSTWMRMCLSSHLETSFYDFKQLTHEGDQWLSTIPFTSINRYIR